MKNLALYVVTVCAYSVAYTIVAWGDGNVTATDAKMYGLIALLALPVNIGGNVFTVIGNAVSEKSIYSICSLYQRAGESAWNLVGLGCWQNANAHTVTFLGLSLYQNAGNCFMVIGVTLYQRAVTSATHFVGVAIIQKANLDAFTLAGLSGYQFGKQEACTWVGMAVYQQTSTESRAFAALTTLKA